MSHVFHRSTQSTPPKAVGGRGVYLYDSNGKQYLDGSGGAAVSCLGHDDADVKAAIQDQVETLSFAHTGFFTSEPAERLAERLVAHAPKGIDRVYLVSGGSEAIEAAMKLARQVMIERGEPNRTRFIARAQSYHGNTLGALGVGGNFWRREMFDPILASASHIMPCYEYRLRRDGETEEEFGIRAADELEKELLRVGPENVIGFVAEPVVGATAGVVPPVQGYFKRIRDICDTYGILLILDEVMCGMGRTGTLFACEQDGISPDIVATAKGLGAGYQPIGAMMCTGEIYDTIAAGSGAFQHGHTYMGHPVAAAAADSVLTRLTDGGLVAQCGARGLYLQAALDAAFGQHPHVGDIRGRGLFRGLEFVKDRDSKTPFSPEDNIAARIKATAFDNGLICYPGSGTVDGRIGDHLLLAPPFIISEGEIDELVGKLQQTFDAVFP